MNKLRRSGLDPQLQGFLLRSLQNLLALLQHDSGQGIVAGNFFNLPYPSFVDNVYHPELCMSLSRQSGGMRQRGPGSVAAIHRNQNPFVHDKVSFSRGESKLILPGSVRLNQ